MIMTNLMKINLLVISQYKAEKDINKGFKNSPLSKFINKLKHEDLTDIDEQCIEHCFIPREEPKVILICFKN